MKNFLLAMVIGLMASAAVAQDKPVPRSIPVVEEDPIELDLSGRPAARDNQFPRARWEHRRKGELWTRVTVAAVQTHGAALLDVVPSDIAEWCPAYAENDTDQRAAFWAGFVSDAGAV